MLLICRPPTDQVVTQKAQRRRRGWLRRPDCPRIPSSAVLAAILLPIAVLASSCGDQNPGEIDAETLQRNLEAANRWDRYPLYWVGHSYRGERLSYVTPDGYRGWGFGYGECQEVHGDLGESVGCTHKISISENNVCGERLNASDRTFNVHGALAAIPRGRTPVMFVVTGRTFISLEGKPRETIPLARALRPLASDQAVGRLEPPAAGFLKGTMPCQEAVARAEELRRQRQIARNRERVAGGG